MSRKNKREKWLDYHRDRDKYLDYGKKYRETHPEQVKEKS